jgi:hypothetical protein
MKWMSLIFVSLSFVTSAANATQSFSGVVETIKGTPIAQATVSLQEKNIALTTQTNAQGEFSFKNIASGKYFLSAEKNKMVTFAEPMTLSKADTHPMQITLIPLEFAVFHYLPVHVSYS